MLLNVAWLSRTISSSILPNPPLSLILLGFFYPTQSDAYHCDRIIKCNVRRMKITGSMWWKLRMLSHFKLPFHARLHGLEEEAEESGLQGSDWFNVIFMQSNALFLKSWICQNGRFLFNLIKVNRNVFFFLKPHYLENKCKHNNGQDTEIVEEKVAILQTKMSVFRIISRTQYKIKHWTRALNGYFGDMKHPWIIIKRFCVLISFKFYFHHKYSLWGYEPQ